MNIEWFDCRKTTVDFEFQALLKRHFTRVMYFDATVMDPVDLDRVKVLEIEIIFQKQNHSLSSWNNQKLF